MAPHIDNTPTFSLERSRSEKVPLQLLSNLVPGQKPLRNVVLAASPTPASEAALAWAVQCFCRKGDAVHLACVIRCLHTYTEVYHSGPGNAYQVQDPEPHHERQDVLRAQAAIRDRMLPVLEAAGLSYDVHVFVDTENAPADAIGTTVLRLAGELGAAAVVLAANDQRGSNPQRLGSVAEWVSRQAQPVPVVLVRGEQLTDSGSVDSNGGDGSVEEQQAGGLADVSAAAPASAAAEALAGMQ